MDRMPTYTVKLESSMEIASGTMAFHFQKPAGFSFKAGQAVDWTLIDPKESDAEGNTRSFSICSAPYEPCLMIATRMRDTAFKRILKTMPVDAEITVAEPWGELILHEDSSVPAVFLTGGIGITPFRSIILQAFRDQLPHRISLFYSNRHPEDAAFLEELTENEKANSNLKLIPTVTQLNESKQPWQGETGHIDLAMLKRHIDQIAAPIYYVAGPPAMITSMQALLKEAGVSDANVRVEQFDGY
jgi:ferredoxin-NADP reductase